MVAECLSQSCCQTKKFTWRPLPRSWHPRTTSKSFTSLNQNWMSSVRSPKSLSSLLHSGNTLWLEFLTKLIVSVSHLRFCRPSLKMRATFSPFRLVGRVETAPRSLCRSLSRSLLPFEVFLLRKIFATGLCLIPNNWMCWSSSLLSSSKLWAR